MCVRSINLLCTVALPTVHKILWACFKTNLKRLETFEGEINQDGYGEILICDPRHLCSTKLNILIGLKTERLQ